MSEKKTFKNIWKPKQERKNSEKLEVCSTIYIEPRLLLSIALHQYKWSPLSHIAYFFFSSNKITIPASWIFFFRFRIKQTVFSYHEIGKEISGCLKTAIIIRRFLRRPLDHFADSLQLLHTIRKSCVINIEKFSDFTLSWPRISLYQCSQLNVLRPFSSGKVFEVEVLIRRERSGFFSKCLIF